MKREPGSPCRGRNLRRGPTASTPTLSSPPVVRWMSASPSPSARACGRSRRFPMQTAGWMDGAADSVHQPGAAPVRLIVRRVKPTPGSQLALFDHAITVTDRDGDPGTDRERIRDLKYLNHMPSGRFAANGAWLAVQVMAHNLARWTARIGLGELATTKTLRRRFFSLAGRLTRSARPHPVPRVALGNPFSRALARLFHSQPDHPPSAQPDSRQSGPEHLSPRPLPAISPSPDSQGLPAAAEGPAPTRSSGPSPPFAPHHPFCCCNVIPSVDSG